MRRRDRGREGGREGAGQEGVEEVKGGDGGGREVAEGGRDGGREGAGREGGWGGREAWGLLFTCGVAYGYAVH